MEGQKYEKRYAYLNTDALDGNINRRPICSVQTDVGLLLLVRGRENCNASVFTQEEITLLLPLLQHFSEHGNIPPKQEIQDQELENISGYKY